MGGFDTVEIDPALSLLGASETERRRFIAAANQQDFPDNLLLDETLLTALSLLSEDNAKKVQAILRESDAQAAERMARLRKQIAAR